MAKSKQNQTKQIKQIGNNIPLIVISILSVIFIYLCFKTKFLQDDSYITFRFLENFINGNGLVFNIGEKVEGYTNFLWLLLLSLFAILKFNYIDFSQYLSVGFGAGCLFLTYFISKDFKVEIPNTDKKLKSKSTDLIDKNGILFNLFPVILLTFTGAFNYWAVSGMETTMFIFLGMMGIYFYLKDENLDHLNWKFSFFILLAALTRPEGLYLFAIIIFHKILYTFYIKRNIVDTFKSVLSKNNLLTYSIFVIPVLIYTLFRLMYYGYPFPNTFYAKTGLSWVYINAGLEYTWNYLKSYGLFGLIYLLPLYLFKTDTNKFKLSFFYIFTFLYTIYIISIGGDVLQMFRFFLMISPLFFILFCKFLQFFYQKLTLKNYSSSTGFAIVFSLAIIGLTYYNYNNQKDNIKRITDLENGLVDKMKLAGQWFNSQQKIKGSHMTIAATTIGAVSYYSGLNVSVIDMLGLTDGEIAHNPKTIPEISEGSIGWKERNYNVNYVLSRKPDYVYFSTGIKPSAYAERALFTNNDFIKFYYPMYMSVPQYDFADITYKRKTDQQANEFKILPVNPEYQKNFINHFTNGMNLSRDKSKINESIKEFNESIRKGPSEFSLPYQFIGELYLKSGNNAKAKEYLQKSIELDDFSVLGHLYLYEIYAKENNLIEATKHYERLKLISPGILR